MKKALKMSLLVIVLAFAVMQFFQIDKTNAAINANETLEAVVPVSPDVTVILGKACNDCHSEKTIYPWYSYVQPFGWFLQNHINDGKRHLNLSKFATYDANRREKKLEEICEQVQSTEMPLPSYTYIHRDAILTESEKMALCDWTKSVVSKDQK